MKTATARAADLGPPAIRQDLVERDSDAGKPFAVELQKASGAWRIFDRYDDRETAHAVARRFSSIGQPARVVAAC